MRIIYPHCEFCYLTHVSLKNRRAIRHAGDYGALLLCDDRFGSPATQASLSAWLRPHVTRHASFGQTLGGCVALCDARLDTRVTQKD